MFTVQEFTWVDGVLKTSTQKFKDRNMAINFANTSLASTVRVLDKKERAIFNKKSNVQLNTNQTYA